LADRITRKTRKEDIPLLGSNLTFSSGFCDQHARIGMSVSGKDGSWQTVMPIVEQMVRQAAEHGFSEQELAEQIKRLDASFVNAVASEPTAMSGAFAAELTNLDKDIVTSAAYRQQLWRQLRPFMTADNVSREFSGWLAKLDRPRIFLAGKKADAVAPDALLAAFADSRKIAVAAPADRTAIAWAYTDFGTPGTVVEDKRIDDLGIRTIRFANGVLLNLKRTEFEKDRIRWSIRIDGGRAAFSAEDQPLVTFMDAAYVNGGLGKYEIDDLRATLAGSTASTAFFIGATAFGSSGSVVKKDLEQQLQLTTALIADPAYRAEAVRTFQRPLPEFYARLDATPGSALSLGQSRIMNGEDLRFTLPPITALQAADFDRLKTALGDSLQRNRLEIGMVGDLDEASAIELVAKTFGALPQRDAREFVAEPSRFTESYGQHIINHKGEPNQLSWRKSWVTTDDSDFRLKQTMSLLADVVQIRLIDELRENLGATYGASAGSDMSETYKGRGTFTISTNGDPKDVDKIEAAVDKVIAEIVAAPVEADLFERARKPTLESYADWRKHNATWINIVDQAQTRPTRLQRFRFNEEQYRSITADEVWEAAKKYLTGERHFAFRVIPQNAAAGDK
jgi:zinc protease